MENTLIVHHQGRHYLLFYMYGFQHAILKPHKVYLVPGMWFRAGPNGAF